LSAGFATKGGQRDVRAAPILVCIIAKGESKLFRPRLARAVISGWRPRDAATASGGGGRARSTSLDWQHDHSTVQVQSEE